MFAEPTIADNNKQLTKFCLFINPGIIFLRQAPFRFTRNLSTIAKSGVVRQLLPETLLIVLVSTFIVVYNSLFVVGFEDFAGAHHNPLISGITLPLFKLPTEPFTLSSSALSLLLGTYYALNYS